MWMVDFNFQPNVFLWPEYHRCKLPKRLLSQTTACLPSPSKIFKVSNHQEMEVNQKETQKNPESGLIQISIQECAMLYDFLTTSQWGGLAALIIAAQKNWSTPKLRLVNTCWPVVTFLTKNVCHTCKNICRTCNRNYFWAFLPLDQKRMTAQIAIGLQKFWKMTTAQQYF